VHARSSASRLEAWGDGGVLTARLDALLAALGDEASETTEVPKGADTLTAKEGQILALMPTNLSLREIGHELYVSRNTTKTHVSQIYRKLGVTTRAAAVARARQLNSGR